jgi:folylpolyglutamate synthase
LTILHVNQISSLDGIEVGLAGVHQKYNAITAVELSKTWLNKVRQVEFKEAVSQVPEGFKKGLKEVKWPGRGQILPVTETKYAPQTTNKLGWYLDGAHTIESLETCAEWFKTIASKKEGDVSRILVFNCTHGRDSGKLLQVISKIQPNVQFDHVVFSTNITFRQGYTTGKIRIKMTKRGMFCNIDPCR